MSELKITGNPTPVVGKEESYSVNQLLPTSIPTEILNGSKPNPFEFPVEWSVHVLENGKWIQKEENNKTGNKVSYKFIQKSLERKGIRILAKKGEQTARLDVKPHNAESPKIDSIEFLDKQGKKPSKPLAYGQTLKARVHCLHMERRTVYATLWEDNDKSKENNKIETRFGTVIDGIVDIDFTLRPSAAKAGLNKDKTHKYYVTTVVNNKNMPSNPVNVKELEPPVPPFKKKTPIQQPNTPTAPVATKNGVSNVYITDINGHPIQGTYKSKKLKVWIESKGLQGKEIKLAIYDEDVTTNDLIYHNNFKISKDLYGIEVNLDKLPISKAGRLEGDIEFFVDIEVLQSQTHTKSGIVNVDAKAFKQDSGAIVNTVLKVFDPSGEEKKNNTSCGEKYCIKKGDKSELIREINIRLAGFGGNVPTDEFTDRTEKMIKQFQRDYMKVPETGKVCGNVLKAIDEFCNKWVEKISDYTCLCKNVHSITNKCSGFGKGRYNGEYSSSSKIERFHKYERPGIHRALLWGTSTLRFYLSKQDVYKYLWKTAGYRCWEHNNSVPRTSTNHMGKAVDIQFSKNGITIGGKRQSNLPLLRDINDKFYSKYLNAKYQWVNGKNNFSIEPIGLGTNQTYSWIHLDVREFDNEYLDDKYFVKTQEKITNGSISELAKKLGFLNTCMCSSGGNNSDTKPQEDAENDKRIDPKKLKASSKAKLFIKDWEAFKPNLYNDDSEDHHCTIGYGHLVHLGPCNGSEPQEFKNGISKERALQLFDLRIADFEKAVQRDITVPLYQYEFDALVSFLFNCGENFFVLKKAPKLYKHLLNKEYDDAAKEFLDVTSGGLGGLVKRRKAENNMFLNNIYDSKH